jgi:hypothetical protein
MNSAQTSILMLSSLVATVLAGRGLRRHLPENHLSTESRDAVKLAMGLVSTMTALLLGLLVGSAKGTYDTQRTEIIQMGAQVAYLDRVLTAYGPEAAEARGQFRGAVIDQAHSLWPETRGSRAQLAPQASAGDRVFSAVQGLSPRDDTQRSLKAQATTLALGLGQLRVMLLAQAAPSIPRPLLIAVGWWLVVTFLFFSLLAPPNATTAVALVAAAVSVAVAIFLIMELDQPLGGMISIPSEPVMNTLSHFTN